MDIGFDPGVEGTRWPHRNASRRQVGLNMVGNARWDKRRLARAAKAIEKDISRHWRNLLYWVRSRLKSNDIVEGLSGFLGGSSMIPRLTLPRRRNVGLTTTGASSAFMARR